MSLQGLIKLKRKEFQMVTANETIKVDALANTHSHLREGEPVDFLIEKAIEGGADVLLPMPNTKDGLRTAEEVSVYVDRARSLVPQGETMHFIPTMLLTEITPLDEIARAADNGIKDVKVYPYLRTTNSVYGVRHYGRIIDLVRECGKYGVKVHFHPEHPWMQLGSRDAEYFFLPIVDIFLNETEAVIVWEHGTDARCIPFWKEMAKSGRFSVTLTPHHLLTNEDLTFGDVRSTCKPPIKTERDRTDLLRLIEEGNSWVMAGPDDAPHPTEKKHVYEGCCACGAYHAPFLLPLYAHALGHLLQTSKGIETFVNFTSRNARKLHGLPNAGRRTLVRKSFQISNSYWIRPWKVEPFWAGQTIDWSLVKES